MIPNGMEMTSQVREDQTGDRGSNGSKTTPESKINSNSRNSLTEDAIIVRRFKPSDLEGALDLDREVFGGYDPTIFTAFYEYHARTTLVAECRGSVVGFVLGFKHTPLEGRVFWLAVRPGYQNRGVGRKLLTSILRIFRFMGALSATLEVRISNKNAQALYSGMGFEMITIYPGYYTDGEPAIIMKRRL
jgi:[ribosomal protein S18]-alanine N-acetyltransferase